MTSRYSTFKDASEMAGELAKQGYSVSIRRDDEGWGLAVSGGKVESAAQSSQESLWVGEFVTGALVVIDLGVKVNGVENAYGFVVTRNLMRQFDQSSMELADRVTGPPEVDALARYQSWKARNLDSFLASERASIDRANELGKQKQMQLLAANEKAKERAIKKHIQYLAKIGKPNSGVNLSTSKRHRVTHCYLCKKSLKNSFHVECNECGWLICECGACGCGFMGKK